MNNESFIAMLALMLASVTLGLHISSQAVRPLDPSCGGNRVLALQQMKQL